MDLTDLRGLIAIRRLGMDIKDKYRQALVVYAVMAS